jgi:hypothetical protein
MAEREAESPQRSLEEDVAPGGELEARMSEAEAGMPGNGYSQEHHHRLGPLTLDRLDRIPGGHRAAATIEQMPQRVPVERVPGAPWAMAAAGTGLAAAAGIGGWMWMRSRRRQRPQERAKRIARQAGYAAVGAMGAMRYGYEHRDEYIGMARDMRDALRKRYGQARKQVDGMDLRDRADEMTKRMPKAFRR